MKTYPVLVLCLALCGCSMFGYKVEPVAPGIRITSAHSTNSIPAATIGGAIDTALTWCGVHPGISSGVSAALVVGIGVAGWIYKRKRSRDVKRAKETR